MNRTQTRTKWLAGIALVGASALVITGCSTPAPESAEEPGGDRPAEVDLTLQLGSLLPSTGSLSFLGAPMEAGVQLAVSEINEAGAGITVELTTADEGDLDNKAYETSITNLQSAGITAMVGAASSSVTKLILDGNAGSGILTVSPSNTSADFTGINPLYFRTAPSDNLQGEVLGNQIAEDGHKTLGIIYQNDPYGTGLFEAIKATFEGTGGEVVGEASYNQGDGQFNAQVQTIAASNPDAVAIVSYDQFATIAPLLGNAGVDTGALYLVDGNLKDWPDLGVSLEGSKGTRAGAELPDDFIDQLNEVWTAEGNDPIDALTYSAEAYDATILIALAALQAVSVEGEDIAGAMQEVSGGSGEGEKCTSFAECAEIINGGGTADYDGYSGDVTFDDDNDPAGAAIGVYEFDAENVQTRIK
ncbi:MULTISPECIES: ABC transporter substrate-binding protein [unclassified Microbacterium]|uniref:ABC transporter substrate-binding protein n=1 Tax=unclassified Microbacterium TaxID=2609290 RepID=UPI00216AA71D|nr:MULTISPECIES: ABC transporter substrate-binding protein [unclassified Microbacterium]MCS3841808.1 branched-chain amino acid transport system substrate-binding protein [Microbacterium sp. AK031]MDP3953104.1 ABC transporter substrate-binding protein [Microbacterium sp.]